MILLGGPVYIDTKFKKRLISTELSTDEYSPENVAAEHKKLGYKAAYVPYIPSNETTLLSKMEDAFKKEDVVLAEMGFWKNIQSKNEYDRMQNIEQMCDALASADEMGVACVVNTIGSYSYGSINDDINKNNFSDEFFDDAVETARYIINRVKPKRTKLTFENFAFTALDSIDQIEKMVSAVDSDSFGIHLDASNLITSVRTFFEFKSLVDESFKRLGDKIISCHLKDLQLVYPACHVEIRETIPGKGMLDISHYLKHIHKISHGIPVMLEHLESEEEYNIARKNVQDIMSRLR